jgi:hypothetical protein
MEISDWITPIIFLVSVLIMVYLVGLSIVKLVDNKLGDIEIKLPQINVNTKLNVSKDAKGLINICSDKLQMESHTSHTSHDVPVEFFEPNVGSIPNEVSGSPKVDTEFKMMNLDSNKIGCKTDNDCNIVNGNGLNVCKSDGTCHCLSGSGTFCQYGPTNYKDPKSMTDEERRIFKYQYRNNFTLQDYKNWLLLYKDDSQHLRENHRDNLAKLLRGDTLYVQDMPNIRIIPPMDPADYFGKMYEGGKISVHFPEEGETGAMLPYNYGKYSEFISPETATKTWITGIVDLYKTPMKDNARELNYYLRPEVTVGVERELVGQEYLNWVKKHHNLADIRKIQIRKDESINTFQDTEDGVHAPV